MSFNGTEGKTIELDLAQEWTKNYRNTVAPDETRALFQGRDNLKRILDQEGCMGIRAYFATDDNGKPQLIYVGADANESDILGEIYDYSTPCPNNCDNISPLNS